jgi:hypothetical protein
MYNRRYYENGGDTMQPDSSGQGIMQAAPQDMQQGMQQGMQQPQSADQAQGQVDPSQIKNPQHALQIIIQMLVAQGIPPEQAKQIAIEMMKAVAQGGMEEVTSDEKVHARFGGHITREHYLFGGIGKALSSVVGGIVGGASGLVKGVVNAVKSVASSNLGKLALLAGAAYFGMPYLAEAFAPAAATTAAEAAATEGLIGQGVSNSALYSSGAGTIGGAAPYTSSLLPSASLTPASASIGAPSLLQTASGVASDPSLSGVTSLAKQAVSSIIPSSVTDAALKYGPSVLGGVIGGSVAGGMPQQQPGESNADFQKRVDAWNSTLSTNMSSPTFSPGAFPNNPYYSQYARKANGGRIGYEDGGIGNIIHQATREGFFGNNMLAAGGVPTGEPRQNTQGIHEIDFRKRGGYVPPIGIKEKADDIPAMLSNNEFVFTADAVRNAGHGDVNKGAKRMYHLMKHLEAGGVA